jgi:hypothetical protein
LFETLFALRGSTPHSTTDNLLVFYFPDEREWQAAVEPHAGIASLKFLAGFCYTQLTDIEQEINGLLTYDRQPKVLAQRIAELHRDMFKI